MNDQHKEEKARVSKIPKAQLEIPAVKSKTHLGASFPFSQLSLVS